MHPVIHLHAGLAIQSHDLMVGLAVVSAATLGFYGITRGEGLPAARVALALGLVALVTLIGGRLHFVLTKWALYADTPWRAVSLSSSALHAPGAILGAILGSAVALPLLRLPAGKFADGLAPAVGIGIACARLGCFLHGCCYGIPCDHWWCVTYPGDSFVFLQHLEANLLPPGATRSAAVHPLPLYFAGAGLGITGVLLGLRPRKRYDGQLGLVLLVLFAASSAVLEPLRADGPTRVYWGSLPQLLWVTAALSIVVGAAWLAFEYRVGLRR